MEKDVRYSTGKFPPIFFVLNQTKSFHTLP